MDKKLNRPRDVSQLAKMMVDIASGEAVVAVTIKEKPNRKHVGGKIGGLARAKKMDPDERTAAAKKAANARWGKNFGREKIEH